MKKIIFIIILIILFSTVVSARERLYVYEPVKFNYVGAVKTGEWYWCRSTGARIIWTWNSVPNIPDVFYVEYTLLQTNGIIGGSGFDSNIKAELIVEGQKIERKLIGYTKPPVTHYEKPQPIFKTTVRKIKKKIAKGVLKMENTFRPVYDHDSKGIGYEAHGYMMFDVPKVYLEDLKKYQFYIIIYWPPLDNEYHFAASPGLKPILVFKK